MELYTKVFNDAANDLDDEFGLASAASMREAIQRYSQGGPSIHAADRGLIRLARRAIGNPLMPEEGEYWWDNLPRIAHGEYLLEKLPEHVRELVRELYNEVNR